MTNEQVITRDSIDGMNLTLFGTPEGVPTGFLIQHVNGKKSDMQADFMPEERWIIYDTAERIPTAKERQLVNAWFKMNSIHVKKRLYSEAMLAELSHTYGRIGVTLQNMYNNKPYKHLILGVDAWMKYVKKFEVLYSKLDALAYLQCVDYYHHMQHEVAKEALKG